MSQLLPATHAQALAAIAESPATIEFFAAAGCDYVSCSPFRVPVARLVAAQLVIDGG
jgi:phosphoenolpyruvate synthase/pyruvate phosphate dikinase